MAEDRKVVIHHNPDCGTSRNVLAIIEAAGYRPTVIEYLKTGLDPTATRRAQGAFVRPQ